MNLFRNAIVALNNHSKLIQYLVFIFIYWYHLTYCGLTSNLRCLISFSIFISFALIIIATQSNSKILDISPRNVVYHTISFHFPFFYVIVRGLPTTLTVFAKNSKKERHYPQTQMLEKEWNLPKSVRVPVSGN